MSCKKIIILGIFVSWSTFLYSTSVGFCGDGTINGSEECDYQHILVESCRDYGGGAGKVKCQPNCLLDISECISKAVDWYCDVDIGSSLENTK